MSLQPFFRRESISVGAMPLKVPPMCRGLVTRDHQALGFFGVPIGVDHHGTVSELVSGPGLDAAITAGGDHIGRAENRGQPLAEGKLQSLGLAQDHGYTLGPEFPPVMIEPPGDGVQGLIPGDARPSSRSPLPGSFERVLQTVGVVIGTRYADWPLGIGTDVRDILLVVSLVTLVTFPFSTWAIRLQCLPQKKQKNPCCVPPIFSFKIP